jgi:hypothetical protein
MATTFNLNADQYTKKALQLCGTLGLGREPPNQVLQDARDILSTMLKTLQSRGVTLTQAVPLTLTLSNGTASYPLPTNLIDVEFPMTVMASGATSETWVEKMIWSDYQVISDKTVTGTPTRCYVEKLSTLTAKFWSVPNGTYTANYRGIQLIDDMSAGTTTPGLTQRWMGALMWRFAYWLSFPLNVPAAKRQELKTEAEQQERDVLGGENERGDLQLCLPSDPYHGAY